VCPNGLGKFGDPREAPQLKNTPTSAQGPREVITSKGVLASEVTPGLLAGAEPDTHQFNVTIFLKG
jgi:hypothetical protein